MIHGGAVIAAGVVAGGLGVVHYIRAYAFMRNDALRGAFVNAMAAAVATSLGIVLMIVGAARL